MKLFASNLGSLDRAARIAVGLGALSMTVVGPQSLLGLLGIVPLVTGLFGTCPAYSIFGLSTKGKSGQPAPQLR